MFKTLRLPAISRPVALILILSFIFTTSGCYYYKVKRSTGPPKETIDKLQAENKFIILHLEDKAWHLQDVVVNESSVTGRISVLTGHESYKNTKPDAANRYYKSLIFDQSNVLNEVHVYVSGFADTVSGRISIQPGDIKKIEIYDKDSGATAASWIFSGIGIGLGAIAIILIIVALTKSSCPFVYLFDGSGYIFRGEIFSGATQPGLERNDFLPLGMVNAPDGICKLKLTNEVREIQSVNFAELMYADHPANTSALIDKYGSLSVFRKPVSPVVAVNGNGKNILDALKERDTIYYSGDTEARGNNGIEEIIVKFVKPAGCKSARLVIRAKNSFWLDILMAKFHRLFGEKYDTFSEKQKSESPEKLRKYLLDQNIPLSVFIEKNGDWKYADYFNIMGPMALREDILTLNLADISSDTVSVKLETGFLFWELDYAGMDFSENETVVPSVIAAASAIDRNGADVSNLLGYIDKKYLVLKDVGDEVLIGFKMPHQESEARSLFLHTSGFYKILREQSGASDRKKLKTFRRPNRFPAFSREMYELLPQK